jgi:hypothetical protein
MKNSLPVLKEFPVLHTPIKPLTLFFENRAIFLKFNGNITFWE